MEISVSKKKKSARSKLLSAVMPLLSSGQGVLMQEAFVKGDVQGVKDAWSKLGDDLAEKAEKESD